MKRGLIGPALLIMLFALFTPLHAGEIVVGGGGGPSEPPDPSEGGETEENWNPIVTCHVLPGQGIMALLTCMENEIENPPPQCPPQGPVGVSGGGRRPGEVVVFNDDVPCHDYGPHARSDFNVEILQPPEPPYYGIRILRLDGSEIERLSFRETDPGIKTTRVTVNQPNLVAIVGLVTQEPARNGVIQLTVDEHDITVATIKTPTSVQLNSRIIDALAPAGYQVEVINDTILIRSEWGVRSVLFRSTDTGITRSSIKLESAFLHPQE